MSETMTKCDEISSRGGGRRRGPDRAGRCGASTRGRTGPPDADQLAIKGTATASETDFGKLYGLVEETMNALWLEPDAARLRLLARAIVVLRAKIELLLGLSDQALEAIVSVTFGPTLTGALPTARWPRRARP
jgi:hypothetical protein